MMKRISLDTGVVSFRLGQGGVLRMNPRDPGLYARFLQAEDKIHALLETASCRDCGSLELLEELDRELKEILNWVFGAPNDFSSILQGVSLLAVGENGRYLLENLFAALSPVLTQGARDCARDQVEKAKQKRAEEA